MQEWQKVTPLEQLMLEEYVPARPCILTILLTLTSDVSMTWVREKVLPGFLLHPRLRSTVQKTKSGRFYFNPVPGFAPDSHHVDRHLVEEPAIPHDLPDDQRQARFSARISEILSSPLPRDRPMWTMHVFRNWALSPNARETSTCLVFRAHHSIADGVALLKYFLKHVIDTGPENRAPTLVMPRRSAAASRNSLPSADMSPVTAQKRLGLRSIFESVQDVGKAVAAPIHRQPASPFVLPPLRYLTLCAMTPMDSITVSSLKSAAASLSVSINDLLLAAFSGAVRTYLSEKGEDMAKLRKMRVAMPFNRHHFDEFQMDELTNQVVMLPIPFHLNVPDREKRLAMCARTMGRLKRSKQPAIGASGMRVAAQLPSGARKATWKFLATSASAIFSNLAGPTQRVSISGVLVSEVLFLPPVDTHITVSVGILSYADRVFMTASGDAARLADPAKLARLFVEEVQAFVDESKLSPADTLSPLGPLPTT